MTLEQQIARLLENPDNLLLKKPFTRGSSERMLSKAYGSTRDVSVGERRKASLPRFEKAEVSQDQFVAELDPACHKVHFDRNIPHITAKLESGGYVDIEFQTMGVPFQKRIRDKHVLYLCGNNTQFTLSNEEPTDQQKSDFIFLKKRWKTRNIDGMRTKMVRAQKSYGDAGLLFYFDRWGKVKCKLISYEDGYVIISHNDENGDRLAECVYYAVNGVEYIDVYTDTVQYQFILDPNKANPDNGKTSWVINPNINGVPHGFNEIPLVTKRGDVAWNDVESLIEVYEIIYNIFLVIQKRHGWGVLYIKGNFQEKAKQIAGNVILADKSMDGSGDAKFLAPPSPEGMLDTLDKIEEAIEKGSGTTFILPKDISTGADVSGVAVQITQSLDNEEALAGVIEWQNAISKVERLFRFGLAKELAENDGDVEAPARFESLEVIATFKQWMPRSDYQYNQMLGEMKNNGILSQKTATEANTESAPDEDIRLRNQAREELDMEKEKLEFEAKAKASNTTASSNEE